jgi:hypothetical protein
MVKVIVFQKGETDHDFIQGGAPISDYLEQAGAVVDEGVTLSLNNEEAVPEDMVIEDNSIIIIANKKGNG